MSVICLMQNNASRVKLRPIYLFILEENASGGGDVRLYIQGLTLDNNKDYGIGYSRELNPNRKLSNFLEINLKFVKFYSGNNRH